MTAARKIESSIQAIRLYILERQVQSEQRALKQKETFDRNFEEFTVFLTSIHKFHDLTRNDLDVSDSSQDRLIARLSHPQACHDIYSEIISDYYGPLIVAITNCCNTVMLLGESELRSQLSVALMDALWLTDSLLQKNVITSLHKDRIWLLTQNLKAVTEFAKHPGSELSLQNLATTTDKMIRGFQSSPFLIFPEDKSFKRYVINITALVLSAALLVATILLVPAHSAIVALAGLAYALAAPVLVGYKSSLSYSNLEGQAHNLRTSLRGFFTNRNVIEPREPAESENANNRLLA